MTKSEIIDEIMSLNVDVILKDCPFCGGKAEFYFEYGGQGVSCIECSAKSRKEYFFLYEGIREVYKSCGKKIDATQIMKLGDLIRENRAAKIWNSRI